MPRTALRHRFGHSTILVAAVALILGLGMEADAKVPPFEMEVDVDETRAIVTVILEDQGFDPPNLPGLVAIYPRSDLDEEGRPTDQTSAIDVPLARIGAGTYQGTVRLEPGQWAAVPFPTVMNLSAADLHPYPGTTHFETSTRPALPLAASGGAVAALVALAAVAFHRRARGSFVAA